ncbi:MAG: hypothetical protein BZY88_03440 [SAR202 cluster bacterium Io17-Chloro-G9]|nr:MAG: hypothetical protein BZY88_03440 [SAR202 cluster bacterium Io17-Chloro-G9]
MTPDELPDHAPATKLFPQFSDELFWMVSTELAGLTDEQLDFESDRWGWSQWSIRRNLSHMASGDYRWLWQRWRQELFPNGLPNGDELDRLLDSPFDRRLDENLYWELDVLLAKLRQALYFAWSVLEKETVGSCRTREIETNNGGLWVDLLNAGYRGIRLNESDPAKLFITLEATLRHRYFEYITHLYNIQRLKRAQGLSAIAKVPMEGYLTLPGWDLSEP